MGKSLRTPFGATKTARSWMLVITTVSTASEIILGHKQART